MCARRGIHILHRNLWRSLEGHRRQHVVKNVQSPTPYSLCQLIDDLSALGLRHVGYGVPTEMFPPFAGNSELLLEEKSKPVY